MIIYGVIRAIGKHENEEIVVVVMGGDGSLGCFIDDITKDRVIGENLSQLVFVPLPFGTGNDLCRSLGWGKSEAKYKNLDALIGFIVRGKRDKLALW